MSKLINDLIKEAPMMGEDAACRSRILLVDHEDWVREFLTSVIKLCGLKEFKLVNSVDEALEAIDVCPYDLIITDHKQPHHQRLIEHVRAHHPTTRFIVMVQQRAQIQHVVYYEQVDIVYKPLSLDETVRKIRHALRQKQLHQAEEEFRRLKQEALKIFLS
jgi:DNA-binding NtrC family response regulator